MIHTCPRCELRFASDTELTDHLKIDHDADPEEFDRLHYKPKSVRPVGKRYLLLANRTLEEPWLLSRLLELAQGDVHFHIVVSPTPTESGGDRTDDKELGLASYRLRSIVDKLHEAGIEAEGEVGNADPLRAVTARSSTSRLTRSSWRRCREESHAGWRSTYPACCTGGSRCP